MPAPKIRWFVALLVAMVVLGVAAGLALSRTPGADAGARHQADPAGDAPTGSLPASSEPITGGPAPASMQAAVAGEPGPSARPVGVTTPASTGPVIVAFRVKQKPTCPSGTDQVRDAGRPVVLEWRVTGAKSVTLSVDGPGVYDSYGAEDSATITFPCEGTAGNEQTHTYTLAVAGPAGTESRTLTVTAPVNDVAAV